MNSLEGNKTSINLLPYHNIAQNKYLKLGDKNSFVQFEPPSEVEIQEIISTFKNYGILATIGG
jgi:pyruvate formate lyase activating enzyme